MRPLSYDSVTFELTVTVLDAFFEEDNIFEVDLQEEYPDTLPDLEAGSSYNVTYHAKKDFTLTAESIVTGLVSSFEFELVLTRTIERTVPVE